MRYIGAVIAALAEAFLAYIRQSYNASSKPLLLIRVLFVLLTIILSTVTIRAIISSSDDDIRTFSDGFRVIFGALLIIISITTIIFLSDFTFLVSYIQANESSNRCEKLFTTTNETTTQL